MVVTRSQSKLMASVGEELQVTDESSMNIDVVFMNKMLNQMDVLNTKMNAFEADNVELRGIFTEKAKSYVDLKMQYEYLEWRYDQTMNEVKELDDAKNQGMDEIAKLHNSLSKTLNEIVILNKVVAQGSIGGVDHIKIKEPNSYD